MTNDELRTVRDITTAIKALTTAVENQNRILAFSVCSFLHLTHLTEEEHVRVVTQLQTWAKEPKEPVQ